ncbi:MAG: ASCH domain-containing protein [Candidatus Paceibacterota bacterium]|jgi:hypothetical protein
MKAITVIQPWTSLIALGEKKIETRSWKTNYRGPLAIHASKTIPTYAKEICKGFPFWQVLIEKYADKNLKVKTYAFGHPQEIEFTKGMIIATCNLVDCCKIRCIRPVKRDGEVIMTAFIESKNSLIEVSGNELSFGDYTPGRYAWILEDVKILDNPIPAKGQQGFWNFDLPGGD